MGVVYRATDTSIGRPVALKVVAAALGGSAGVPGAGSSARPRCSPASTRPTSSPSTTTAAMTAAPYSPRSSSPAVTWARCCSPAARCRRCSRSRSPPRWPTPCTTRTGSGSCTATSRRPTCSSATPTRGRRATSTPTCATSASRARRAGGDGLTDGRVGQRHLDLPRARVRPRRTGLAGVRRLRPRAACSGRPSPADRPFRGTDVEVAVAHQQAPVPQLAGGDPSSSTSTACCAGASRRTPPTGTPTPTWRAPTCWPGSRCHCRHGSRRRCRRRSARRCPPPPALPRRRPRRRHRRAGVTPSWRSVLAAVLAVGGGAVAAVTLGGGGPAPLPPPRTATPTTPTSAATPRRPPHPRTSAATRAARSPATSTATASARWPWSSTTRCRRTRGTFDTFSDLHRLHAGRRPVRAGPDRAARLRGRGPVPQLLHRRLRRRRRPRAARGEDLRRGGPADPAGRHAQRRRRRSRDDVAIAGDHAVRPRGRPRRRRRRRPAAPVLRATPR